MSDFWSPDMSGLYTGFQYGYLDMSGPSAKILSLDQNLLFWLIYSIYLDLCDHVKILSCLNSKWIIIEDVLSWIIYLDLSHCQLLEEGQALRHHQVNQDYVFLRSAPALSSSTYPPKSLFKVLVQDFLKKEQILMIVQIKIPSPEFFLT
jgi:hypothetical protein